MTHSRRILGSALGFAALATGALAQQVYPTRGQGPSTQARDEAECSQWATRESGYDPSNPPRPVTAEPAPVTGSGARVRGAAVGAIIGGVAGDAGDGALAGAAVGGIARRGANRRAAAAQNEAAQAPQTAWREARRACLSSRGYTVD